MNNDFLKSSELNTIKGKLGSPIDILTFIGSKKKNFEPYKKTDSFIIDNSSDERKKQIENYLGKKNNFFPDIEVNDKKYYLKGASILKNGHWTTITLYKGFYFIINIPLSNNENEIRYLSNKSLKEILKGINKDTLRNHENFDLILYFSELKSSNSKNRKNSDINFEKLSEIEYSYGEKLGKRFDYLQEQIKKGKTIIFPVYPNKNNNKFIKDVNEKMKKKYITNLGLGIAIGKSSNTNSINKTKFEEKEKLLDEINEFAKKLKEKYPDNVKFEKIKKADELKKHKFIQVWGANENNRNKPEEGGRGQASIVSNLIKKGVAGEYFYGIDTMSPYNEVKPTNNSTAKNKSSERGKTSKSSSGITSNNNSGKKSSSSSGKNGKEICNNVKKHHNSKKSRNNSNSSNNAFSIGLNKKIQEDLITEEENTEGLLRSANNLNNRERNSLVKKILFIRKLRRIFEYIKDKNFKFNNTFVFNEKTEMKIIESLIDSNNNNS